MGRKRTRLEYTCPQCEKIFIGQRSRLKHCKTPCCSLKCSSNYTAKQRADKLRIRTYPYKCGICIECGKDIIAQNAGHVKQNRLYCSKRCHTRHRNIKNNPIYKPGAIEKMRKANTGKTYKRNSKDVEAMRIRNLGNKSHFWKGGLTNKNRRARNSAKTKRWRKKVFERDNYTCQSCGSRNGNGRSVYLEAHHIKSWSDYPKLRWNIDNGITLCKTCHKKTDNYASHGDIVKEY